MSSNSYLQYTVKPASLFGVVPLLLLLFNNLTIQAQHIKRTDTIYFSPENKLGVEVTYKDRKQIGFHHNNVEYRVNKKNLHNIHYADGVYMLNPKRKEDLSSAYGNNLVMINTFSLLLNQIEIRYERFFANGAFSINPYIVRTFSDRISFSGLYRSERTISGLALNYYPLKQGIIRPYIFISGEYVLEGTPYMNSIDMALFIGNGFNFQLTKSINLSTSLGLGRAFVFETNRNGFYLNGQLSIGYRF